MSRIEQWLPFFERPSLRRDTASWKKYIDEEIERFDLKPQQLVSDRASALIQLGQSDYYGVGSMPDLFHFNQNLAHKAGSKIGKAWSKISKAYYEMEAKCKAYQEELFTSDGKGLTKEEYISHKERNYQQDIYLWQENCHRRYQNGIHWIHKAIHPFDSNGKFEVGSEIRRVIVKGITMVEEALISSKALSSALSKQKQQEKLAKKSTKHTAAQSKKIDLHEVKKEKQKDGLDVDTLESLFKQIPDMLQGVDQWQEWTKERLTQFMQRAESENYFPQIKSSKLKYYLLYYLLPLVYWQLVLQRLSRLKKNDRLRKYYQRVLEDCQAKLNAHELTDYLVEAQQQICYEWCVEVARSFQRSSSQVEGRNGYLAFVHKATRGMPKQRLQVLTVVHNFDIRGLDGKTPAERLFGKIVQQHTGRNFPDLLEFLVQDVTSFPEPRHHKPKPPKTLYVRA